MLINDHSAYFCKIFYCVDICSKRVSNSVFEHCIFQGVDFSAVEFNACEFINCIFAHCNLNGTVFSKNRLISVKFFNVNS